MNRILNLLDYTKYLKNRQGSLTTKAYLGTVKRFLEFINYDPKKLTQAEASKFLSFINSQGVGPRSLNRHASALRSFFKFQTGTELLIDGFSFEKRLPVWLDVSKTKKLVAACETDLDTVVVKLLWGCYDEKTEVLTKGGWKYFKDTTLNDEVATLNSEGFLEYHYPEHYFEYDYDGPLYHISTRQVELSVTPGHNLYVALQQGAKGANIDYFGLHPVDEIFSRFIHRHKKDAKWTGEEKEKFTIYAAPQGRMGPKMHDLNFHMDDWLILFGIWLAEGSTTVSANGHYTIQIRNCNQSLMAKIQGILTDYSLKPYMQWDECRLTINNKALYLYLQQFGKSYDKFIPEEIKNLSSRQLRLLLDFYLAGDGYYYRDTSAPQCWTTSKRLRDDLQEVALKIGWSANYYLQSSRKASLIDGRQIVSRRPCWKVGFVKRHNQPHINQEWCKNGVIQYSGKVYCLMVPNHIMYVRRNGKPVWCGNSGLRISELASLEVSNIEGRTLKILGKGAKERMVPIQQSVLDVLEAYIDKHKITGKIFPYSIEFIERRIKATGQKAKLGRVTPHMLRHSYATQYLDKSRNDPKALVKLQHILGHESLATTGIYTHCAVEELVDTLPDIVED